MPIRINLLAESQALEELRRRDPVKRAIWIGSTLGVVLLCWSGWLQAKAIKAKLTLSGLETTLRAKTNDFQRVLENKRKLEDVNQKTNALQMLTTFRLLNAPILNALQHTIVDDVQLVHFRTEHAYVTVEESKPKTNSNGRITPGRPATITEKITLTLEARDTSPNPGDQIPKYQATLADCSYFQRALGKTNVVRLKEIGNTQRDASGKDFVQFSLECRFPEKTR